MNGGQMWILEKVISLEEDLENWTMAQNLHSWMIGRLQEGAPGSSTQIGSGVYKAPLQGFPYYWRWDELNTPMYGEVISLVLFEFWATSNSNFSLNQFGPPKATRRVPHFGWSKQCMALRNRVTLQTDHRSKPMAKGPRVFLVKYELAWVFFMVTLWKLTRLKVRHDEGPRCHQGFSTYLKKVIHLNERNFSLLSVLKTDLSLNKWLKSRGFFLSRFWHSHKNFANLVDHFLKGQRSFCWFCCAHITYQIFVMHPWYQLLMSPKTDLKKSPKQTKTPKSSQVFFSFFWNKKLHPLPTFNKKTKKSGRGTPTWDVFFLFFGEVYLATNVWIFGAVPQVWTFEVDGWVFFLQILPRHWWILWFC